MTWIASEWAPRRSGVEHPKAIAAVLQRLALVSSHVRAHSFQVGFLNFKPTPSTKVH